MAHLNYVELPATDYAKSKAFYADVFSLNLTDYGTSYCSTTTGLADLSLQGDASAATPAPLPVILVDDLEAALVSVINGGGTIVRPIFAFPGGRRFHFRDPSGNEVAAWVHAVP